MLPNEKMEDWAARVYQYELEIAQKRIARGDNIDEVLEYLASRIQQKMLHPVITAIRESSTKEFDPEQNRQEYERSKNWRNPDHVSE